MMFWNEPSSDVPVLYKISTLVDFLRAAFGKIVPVLYKISTLVDFTFFLSKKKSSRSLQNFYCCRCALRLFLLRAVPVLYKISTVVDDVARRRRQIVPVLYKISTVVDISQGRST